MDSGYVTRVSLGWQRIASDALSVDTKSAAAVPIRVLTVDGHALVRNGIAAVIREESDLSLVAEARNGQEALALFRSYQPDVTVMELRMPDICGFDVISAIRSESPQARVIVLSTYAGDVRTVRALRAGASAYLLKQSVVNSELVTAIRMVHAGKRYIPQEIATAMAEHAGDVALTCREIEVLHLIATGRANKDVASALAISEGTVKAHMKNIMPKLGARDRTHAVMIAMRRGIINVWSLAESA
jgi:DNA-binding NarL/FixJ family response regulator